MAVDYLLQPYRVGIDSAKVLCRLVNMQFARGEAGRFYLHQADRDYALSRIPEGELDDRHFRCRRRRGVRNAAPPPFTCHALLHRAAEYFKEIRRPREEWKSLDDLLPHLTEFDLRTAGGDYDAAARVLLEISSNYLELWGHSRLLAERYTRLDGKLTDAELELRCVLMLGSALFLLGEYARLGGNCQRALALSRSQHDRWSESTALNQLGLYFGDLGDIDKAVEYYQQALSISQELGEEQKISRQTTNLALGYHKIGRLAEAAAHFEEAISVLKKIGDYKGISNITIILSRCLYDMGQTSRSRLLAAEALQLARDMGYRLIEAEATNLLADLLVQEGRIEEALTGYEDARAIANEIGDVRFPRIGLAWALLYQGDIPQASAAAEDARLYHYPPAHPDVLVVGGVLALREGNGAVAREELTAAVGEAEKLLSRPAKPFGPAYARALACAGLALCPHPVPVSVAVQAYRDAHAICSAPGIVKDTLQRLDALSVADTVGILTPVRAAAGEA